MNISPSTPSTAPDPVSPRQAIVLVAALNEQGELLLLKRPEGVHCADLWSFPGGKIRAGESVLVAAGRELQEETGLAGEQWQRLGESAFDYPDRRLHIFFFSCLCPDTSRLCTESRHAWVPFGNLEPYEMPAANAGLMPLLKKGLSALG